MKELLRSASKLVFLMFATTICAVFAFQVAVGKAKLEEATFKEAALVALTYYFTRDKGEKPSPASKEGQKDINPIE